LSRQIQPVSTLALTTLLHRADLSTPALSTLAISAPPRPISHLASESQHWTLHSPK